jgi:hypothetical protein
MRPRHVSFHSVAFSFGLLGTLAGRAGLRFDCMGGVAVPSSCAQLTERRHRVCILDSSTVSLLTSSCIGNDE